MDKKVRAALKLLRVLGLLILLLPASLWFILCFPFSTAQWHGEKTDHFDGHRFFNPEASPHGALNFLYWQVTRKKASWPKWVDIGEAAEIPERVGQGQLLVTFINHATVLIQMDGYNILTDPIWSDRASPVSWAGPKRVHAPGIRFEDLPLIDMVLISHNHYDSLDLPTLQRLSLHHQTALIVCPLGNTATLRMGVTDPIQELDWWEHLDLVEGLRIWCVPAQHGSKRGLCDGDSALWGGFVLEGPSGKIFFAGDSGYGPHFQEIEKRIGKPRLALLPIGAYSPEWFMRGMHLNPEDAVQAHLDLEAGSSMGIHFGTFQLSDEERNEPVQRLQKSLRAQGISPTVFRTLSPGESWLIP